MKSFFVSVSIILAAAGSLFAQDLLLENYIQKWNNAAAYTIEMAEAMPEEKYDFRPVEGVRSFREQLLHMMQNMVWLSSTYLGHGKFEADLKSKEYSKAGMIRLLKDATDFAAKAVKQLEPHDLRMQVEFFAGPMNIGQILRLMNDHLTHHRGQIIVYLRLNGIVPPRYVGW